jgi:broad specificity phosphatase PhoE
MTPNDQNGANLKYVYFIRHGQDVQGSNDLFQSPDSPLTDLGREQARFVADRVRDLGAEVILTSPMVRARETAHALQEVTQLPLHEVDLFREYIPPSQLFGISRTSGEGRAYVDAMIERVDDPAWHYADEDNYHDLHHRAVSALDFLIARPESHIIAVTHAGFMRVMLTAMMTEGKPDALMTSRFMRFLRPMHTGITICRYKATAIRRNKWRMVAWNDHAHLGDTTKDEPR